MPIPWQVGHVQAEGQGLPLFSFTVLTLSLMSIVYQFGSNIEKLTQQSVIFIC